MWCCGRILLLHHYLLRESERGRKVRRSRQFRREQLVVRHASLCVCTQSGSDISQDIIIIKLQRGENKLINYSNYFCCFGRRWYANTCVVCNTCESVRDIWCGAQLPHSILASPGHATSPGVAFPYVKHDCRRLPFNNGNCIRPRLHFLRAAIRLNAVRSNQKQWQSMRHPSTLLCERMNVIDDHY